jgi:uncharacterized protein
MRRLTLTSEEFVSLAAGHGSDTAIATLIAGQLAKRQILIWGVVRDARAMGLPVEEPVELLSRVHARAPRTLDEVVAHPQVDAWAADFPRTRAVGYLHALAAAAAIRAGLPFELDVPQASGAVTLPGVGHLADAAARLVFDGDTLSIGGRRAPLRRLRTISLADLDGPVVAIDDVDQYRAVYGVPVARCLADPDRFVSLWRQAWKLLVADHPRHARATRMMLRSFVPLEPPHDRAEHSASSSRASGAIALAPPRTAASMALLVLHETQHLKLGALLDLIDLDTGDRELRFRAPWRGDPRPIRGLLQGTYAHLGVTEFWRGRDARQFAYWRAQTSRAAATLADSGALTAEGTRFVDGMRTTLDAWAREAVPTTDRRVADLCGLVNDAAWRLAHRTAPADALAELLSAWHSGSAPPTGLEGTQHAGSSAEARILAAIRTARPDLSEGDRALLAGDAPTAAGHYARSILAGASANDDWAGLVVALGGSARPEVSRDVYRALASGGRPPDPRAVVRWCATAG